MRRPHFIFLLVAFLILGVSLVLTWSLTQPNLINPVLETLHFTQPLPKVSWGFLPYWSLSKFSDRYYRQFTHLNYFSLTLDADGHLRKYDNPREQEPGWNALNRSSTASLLSEAKQQGLTLSLTVFSGETDTIRAIVAHPDISAANTLADVLPLMDLYGFSDLNLDLEDPQETPDSVRTQFIAYVAAIKSGLKQHSRDLTLSLDYISISTVRPRLTDLAQLNFYIDRFIVMAYDYHSPGSTVAGPVAPASGSGQLRAFDTTAAIDSALTLIPKSKLVLGVPIYGYQWQTLSPTLGSATIPRTGQTATAARVENLLANCSTCQSGWDDVSQEAWAIIPEGGVYSQIFYGDHRALAAKIATAKAKNLGGIAVWALGYEGESTLTPLEDYVSSLRAGH